MDVDELATHPDPDYLTYLATSTGRADLCAALAAHPDPTVAAAATINDACTDTARLDALAGADDRTWKQLADTLLTDTATSAAVVDAITLARRDAAPHLWERAAAHPSAGLALHLTLLDALADGRAGAHSSTAHLGDAVTWLYTQPGSTHPNWAGAGEWTRGDAVEVALAIQLPADDARELLTRPDLRAARAAAAARLPLDDADADTTRRADPTADTDAWLGAALRANPTTPGWWLALTAATLPAGDTDGLRGLLAHPHYNADVAAAAAEAVAGDATLTAELLRDPHLDAHQIDNLLAACPPHTHPLIALRAATHPGSSADLRHTLRSHPNVWVRRAAGHTPLRTRRTVDNGDASSSGRGGRTLT